MFIDPEHAHEEQALLKEIARLNDIVYGNHDDVDLDTKGKVLDEIKECESKLKKVRNKIRKNHQQERQTLYRHLQGILLALIAIFILLAYKSLK